jgi:hypothetical protein
MALSISSFVNKADSLDSAFPAALASAAGALASAEVLTSAVLAAGVLAAAVWLSVAGLAPQLARARTIAMDRIREISFFIGFSSFIDLCPSLFVFERQRDETN